MADNGSVNVGASVPWYERCAECPLNALVHEDGVCVLTLPIVSTILTPSEDMEVMSSFPVSS